MPAGRKVHRTFAEAGEEYLVKIEDHPKHGRNIARKQHHIRKRLVRYFKAHRLDNLTEFAIAQYVRQRKIEGAAEGTINRELSTLSHFLNRCADWGWIKIKPRIDKGQEVRKQIVVLDETDRQALVRGAMSDQDPLTWLFVTIAMSTGMRHSEVLRVRWEEIDFARLRIYVGKAKAGQREQPIPAWFADCLKSEWLKQGKPVGYLFPTARADAKSQHRQTMAAQFRRAVVRAKLDPAKVTPHILRHTAITGLVKAGVDLPTIQKISGHKTLSMVLRYTQLSDSHVDDSLALLDGGLSDTITRELHIRPRGAERGSA